MKNKTFFEYPDFNNIKEIIYHSVEKYPDNIAFKVKEKKDNQVTYKDITYRNFLDEVNNFGTGLFSLGLKGKKIAIISKNRYEWALTFVSTLLGGMIVVPLDKDLTEVEIRQSLNRVKVDCIVYDKKYEEIIKTLEIKNKLCMDTINEKNNIEYIKNRGNEEIQKGNKEYINTNIDEKKLAELVFTSGTTSQSKVVMLSQYNIAKNICDMQKVEPFESTDVNLAFLPFHHTFGSTGQLVMLSSGITTAFPDGLRYVGKNLKEYNVTFFVGVPKLIEAIYNRLNEEIEKQGKTKIIKVAKIFTNFLLKLKIDVRRKVYKKIIDQLGGLRFVISGAANLNKNVEKGLNELGIFTVQGYGLTETSPVIAAENYKYRKYGSIGVPMPSVKLEIANKNEDGIGEIRVKAPNLMLGYYEDEEATKSVIKDGWFYTGDLAYQDKNGYIFIAGRKKDMIVLKNGKKIFPEEIEDVINRIDLVEESFVFGMPKNDDLLLSVKVKYDEAVVKEKYGNIKKEELEKIIWEKVKEANKLLPKYKYVKNMILTDKEFIKTSTNKIKRFEEIKKIAESN